MTTCTTIFLAAFLTLSGSADQTLRVVPLPRDGEVLVSFQLAQALTPELRTAIRSGMIISFVYKVDLRRSSATWLDRTIASSVVKATVKYDNLTRRYHLTRVLDGSTDTADTTDSEELAWAWVTTQFERLPLFRRVPLESNAEYYVRVRAHTSPRNASFVWPWGGDDAVGLAKFTFLR